MPGRRQPGTLLDWRRLAPRKVVHHVDRHADSQEDLGNTTGKDVAGHADMRQAYDDLQQGQVDTDLRNIGGVDEVVNDRPGQSPEKVVKKPF